jgi:SNF2 family DNA or RNA helicase
VLVLDESHWVKNRQSLTSTAARHFAPRCAYRWLLTGTPVTNTAADLHAQIGIVADGRPLGSFEAFVAEYASATASERLRARVAPYLLRRTKDQCLDLPAKTFVDLRVELPGWQRTLYNQMRDELVAEIRNMSGEEFRAYAPTALARTLRLSQIASNPALLLPTDPRVPGKLTELDALVAELVEGEREKLIIWSHYVGTIERLIEHYERLHPVALYGATPSGERQELASRFQTDPETRLMIANPAAAGTGFTFTAAKYAVYETLSWRYDLYAQSQDRIHRIGQERPVTYIRLIAADTIEEVISTALEGKAALARALLGDPDAAPALTSMSREAFCEMLNGNRDPMN